MQLCFNHNCCETRETENAIIVFTNIQYHEFGRFGMQLLLAYQREAAPQEPGNRIQLLTKEKCILYCTLLAATGFKMNSPEDNVMF